MKPFLLTLFVVLYVFTNHSSCTSSSAPSDEETYSGTFQSVKGVMNSLSCYCYNAGYLTTKDGEKIAVCFEKMKDEDISCEDIMTITGSYEEVKHENTNDTDPCPEGTFTVFMATSYKCNP